MGIGAVIGVVSRGIIMVGNWECEVMVIQTGADRGCNSGQPRVK